MAQGEVVQTSSKPRWPKAALFAGLVVAAVYAYQWLYVYTPERDRLMMSIHSSREEEEKVRVTSSRLPEFAEDYEKRENELAELRRKLPDMSEITSFAEDIDRLAQELGVQVAGEDFEHQNREFYWKHRLIAVLSGPESAIEALRQGIEEQGRLVTWVVEEEAPEASKIQLSVYSRQHRPSRNYRSPCSMQATRPALWPYSRWLSHLKSELQTVCYELEEHREILELLDSYVDMLQEIETLDAIVDQIEKDSGRSN
jgi:Tfp pilus assembly protein PilO